jgi:heat shock protein HslJ
MRFVAQDGRTLSGARPAAGTSAAGVRPAFARYSTDLDGQPVVATVYEEICADSMSGMPHPNRVVVSVAGREYRGCGGEPARLLQGGEWVVEDIDSAGIVDRSRATLVFGLDGRISGRASCNTYGGQYKLTGESLTIDKAATTMMACAPSLDAQEQRFLAALAATQRFEITGDGALLLLGSGDRSIKARRQ